MSLELLLQLEALLANPSLSTGNSGSSSEFSGLLERARGTAAALSGLLGRDLGVQMPQLPELLGALIVPSRPTEDSKESPAKLQPDRSQGITIVDLPERLQGKLLTRLANQKVQITFIERVDFDLRKDYGRLVVWQTQGGYDPSKFPGAEFFPARTGINKLAKKLGAIAGEQGAEVDSRAAAVAAAIVKKIAPQLTGIIAVLISERIAGLREGLRGLVEWHEQVAENLRAALSPNSPNLADRDQVLEPLSARGAVNAGSGAGVVPEVSEARTRARVKQSINVIGVKGDKQERLRKRFKDAGVELNFIDVDKIGGRDTEGPTVVWTKFVSHKTQRFSGATYVRGRGGLEGVAEAIAQAAGIELPPRPQKPSNPREPARPNVTA